ncbi:hypothetical protein WMF18_31765 [Sorangium sp. So ce315]|uniref:hypothetical protein n=1 Tax=Sorangium sp. So ce315 TaxID=3133299 RepID=UPI003F5DC8F1
MLDLEMPVPPEVTEHPPDGVLCDLTDLARSQVTEFPPARVWPPDSLLVPPVTFPLEPELASAHLGGARRVPSFVIATRTNRHAEPFNVDEERREALADRLRTLLETWTPPELTPEIVDTARQRLKAEGDTSSPEEWDAASWESPSHDPGAPPEDYLLWPEGIPAILKGKWPPNT